MLFLSEQDIAWVRGKINSIESAMEGGGMEKLTIALLVRGS